MYPRRTCACQACTVRSACSVANAEAFTVVLAWFSIATPSLYLDFSWQVISDQHGSDHFPICIHSCTTAPPVTNGTWKLAKANWINFSSKAFSNLGRNYPNNLEDPIEHFTDILTNILPIVLFLKANRALKNVIPFGLMTNA